MGAVRTGTILKERKRDTTAERRQETQTRGVPQILVANHAEAKKGDLNAAAQHKRLRAAIEGAMVLAEAEGADCRHDTRGVRPREEDTQMRMRGTVSSFLFAQFSLRGHLRSTSLSSDSHSLGVERERDRERGRERARETTKSHPRAFSFFQQALPLWSVLTGNVTSWR